MKINSPLEIQILLHYHYSPVDYPNRSEAFYMSMRRFEEAGLFTCDLTKGGEDQQMYIPDREALEMYVKALLNVPAPKRKWVIEPDLKVY